MKSIHAHSSIGIIRNILRGLSTTIAASSIALMAILMTTEVFLRYLLSSPLGWNVSFVQQYLMIGLVFFGLSYTYRCGSHVSVDLLYDRASRHSRLFMNIFSSLILLITLSFIIWASLLSTIDAWRLNEIPPPGGADLSWPTWIWRAILPLGATLMWIEVLDNMINILSSETHAKPSDF